MQQEKKWVLLSLSRWCQQEDMRKIKMETSESFAACPEDFKYFKGI